MKFWSSSPFTGTMAISSTPSFPGGQSIEVIVRRRNSRPRKIDKKNRNREGKNKTKNREQRTPSHVMSLYTMCV